MLQYRVSMGAHGYQRSVAGSWWLRRTARETIDLRARREQHGNVMSGSAPFHPLRNWP